jgi:hypothetical protein
METTLERNEYKLPVPLSKIKDIPFRRQVRLPTHPQWPTGIEELYMFAVETVKGINTLVEVYRVLYRKIRSLIVPKNLKSRIGAYKAFKMGQGDCDEMTDLFITLCRCLGIPARRLTGYHVNKDGNVENHAWVEVPCPGTTDAWLPVDPAMFNFFYLPTSYIARKIEASVSQVSDVSYSWKGRSNVSLSSSFMDKTVQIDVIKRDWKTL